MSKHTAGPWASTFNSAKERGVRANGGYICFLPKPSHYTGQDKRYEDDLEENKANAKLIESAPDLLEALSFCASVLKSQGLFDRSEQLAYEKAEAAIKKATE